MNELQPISADATGARPRLKFSVKESIERDGSEMQRAMQEARKYPFLTGKRGFITGVGNEGSIAWRMAQVMHAGGAELEFSIQDESYVKHTKPLFDSINAPYHIMDITNPDQVKSVFQKIGQKGGLSFLVHCMAGGLTREDFEKGLLGMSPERISKMLEITGTSLLTLAREAVPLLEQRKPGDDYKTNILAVTYEGDQIVQDYIVGPGKALLNYYSKHLAAELGPKDIRVNTMSPGPFLTRAATAIKDFNDMESKSKEMAPLGNATMAQVAKVAYVLVSGWADGVTGAKTYIDGGVHVLSPLARRQEQPSEKSTIIHFNKPATGR